MKTSTTRLIGTGELYASVTQALVDRILGDTAFPLTAFEQWYGFHEALKPHRATADISRSRAQKLFVWASDNAAKEATAAQIDGNVTVFRAQMKQVIDHKKYADAKKQKWIGPSDRELKLYQALGFEVRVHLAYLKVFLPDRPSILLNGPKTDISNLGVGADAIGELWVKRPKLECIRECEFLGIKFCCEVKVVWVWEKWATVSVNNFKIKADASLYAELESLLVNLRGEFRKLRIDAPILDQIPLEPVANDAMKNKKFPVYDLNQLVLALPVVNKKYQIDSAQLSGSKELRVDLVFKLK